MGTVVVVPRRALRYHNRASLLRIQAMLGHEDPKTTARYIGAFDDDRETVVDFMRD